MHMTDHLPSISEISIVFLYSDNNSFFNQEELSAKSKVTNGCEWKI